MENKTGNNFFLGNLAGDTESLILSKQHGTAEFLLSLKSRCRSLHVSGALPKVMDKTWFLVGVGLKFLLPLCLSAKGLAAPRDSFCCCCADGNEFRLGCAELERKTSEWMIKIKKLLVNAGIPNWTAKSYPAQYVHSAEAAEPCAAGRSLKPQQQREDGAEPRAGGRPAQGLRRCPEASRVTKPAENGGSFWEVSGAAGSRAK